MPRVTFILASNERCMQQAVHATEKKKKKAPDRVLVATRNQEEMWKTN